MWRLDDPSGPSTPLLKKEHWQSTTLSNQNRILLNRRPHQNLIDNEIWTQRATFSTKIGVQLGLFCHVFAIFSSNLDLAQKRRVLRADSHMVIIDSAVARPCPVLPGLAIQADPDPSLFLTRRSSGRHSLAKHNSLKPESHTPQA